MITLILVVCACAVLIRHDVSLVSPLSLAIVTFVLSYCVRPLYLSLRGDVESIADTVNPELFVPALGLVLAFVVSFLGGHLTPWGLRLARFLPVPHATWARRRVLLVQALLGALSVVLYLVLLRLSGMSLGAAFLQPTDFRAVTSAEGLFYISGLLLWSMWAIFFLEMIGRAPDGFTPIGLLTLAALAGVLVVFTLPFGARGFVLGPFIGILWVLDMAVLKRRLSLAVVTPVCFVVAVFVGGYGVYRDFNAGFSSDRYLDEAIANAFGIDLLDRFAARFDNFDFLVWTIDEFPTKRQGYLLGRSAIDFLVQPIPRSVMPDKPSQTSAFLMDVLKPTYDRTITPEFGLISELYINAWIPGVMLGAFAWGVAMRALNRTSRHSGTTLRRFLVFVDRAAAHGLAAGRVELVRIGALHHQHDLCRRSPARGQAAPVVARMRVLFLTSRPPFPVSGDRVRVRQQIAWLARSHDVRILTFVRSPGELRHVEQLRAEGLQVTSVPVRRFEAASGVFRAGLRGRPLQTGYFDSVSMAAQLRRLLAADAADVVYFHLVRMAQVLVEGCALRASARHVRRPVGPVP